MKAFAPILLLILCVGCSTTVPVVQQFPKPPVDLIDPAELDMLQQGAKLSDLLQNVNTNYSKYHKSAARLRAWNEWYRAQKKLFNDRAK